MMEHASTHAHDDHGHGHGPSDGRVHAHISSWQFMVGIFGALIFLTVLTVAVSYVDLGPANTVVAVLIATMKAALVATFFMHLRHDARFNTFVFLMAFVFLGVFLLYTYDDLSTRGKVEDSHGTHILGRSGEIAPGGMPDEYTQPAAAHEAAASNNQSGGTHSTPTGSAAGAAGGGSTEHH